MSKFTTQQIQEKIRQEGDYHTWSYKGKYLCEIVRRSGNWCGYVVIPKGHPCFGLDYDDIEDKYNDKINVHGGITYSEGIGYEVPLSAILKDLDEDNNNGKGRKELKGKASEQAQYWKIGFDTVHFGDLSANKHTFERLSLIDAGEYRDKDYVIAQTNRLAEQLEAIENNE